LINSLLPENLISYNNASVFALAKLKIFRVTGAVKTSFTTTEACFEDQKPIFTGSTFLGKIRQITFYNKNHLCLFYWLEFGRASNKALQTPPIMEFLTRRRGSLPDPPYQETKKREGINPLSIETRLGFEI